MQASHLLAALLLGSTLTARAGEFVNLDFNEPDTTHFHYDATKHSVVAPVADAFRGWSMQWDWTGTPLPMPDQIGVEAGDAPLGLHVYGPEPFGSYYVLVDEYWQPLVSLRPVLHLYQVGTVPANAWQLLFYQDGFWPGKQQVSAYIDGQLQYEYGLPGVPAYSDIDVSPFAGRDVKLEFVFPSGPNQYHEFDILGFTSIPEPSTWVLLAPGVVGLWCLRRKRRNLECTARSSPG